MNTLISIENLIVNYGEVKALKGISLKVDEGDIVAVLGANGAGKTTLLKAISRLVSIKSGTIRLKEKDLSKFPAFKIAGMGVAHVPEGRRVFSTLSVEENLNIGFWSVRKKMSPKKFRKNKNWIFHLFPILKDRKKQLAGTLSGGEQQMLAISRALVSEPRILLLDEPSLGLAPILVQEIFQVIEQIHNENNVSILLVEQNARKALAVAHYGYVLETGKIAFQGLSADLKENKQMKAAYLGGASIRLKNNRQEK